MTYPFHNRRATPIWQLSTVPSSPLLLDSLSATAIGAYSSRKLRNAYAGSALTETTSAAGNATQNIGFDGSGNLNTTALASFIGANSGSIRVWFDQSPSANNIQQTNVSRQPINVNSGVNDTQNGHVWPSGTTTNNTFMTTVAGVTITQPFTFAILFRFDVTIGSNALVADGASFGVSEAGGPKYTLAAGSVFSPTGPPTPDTSIHTGIFIAHGASSQIIIDGSALTGNAGTSNAVEIGPWFFTAGTAHIGELLVFNSAISGTDQSTIRSSWQSYWGAP